MYKRDGYFKNSYKYEWDKDDINKMANKLKKEYNAKDSHDI